MINLSAKPVIFVFLLTISITSNAVDVVKGALQCNIDLNHDGKLDVVVYLENNRRHDLVALVKKENGYEAFILQSSEYSMQLSCDHGLSVTETKSGKGNPIGKEISTGGAYIKLKQPEGSSVVYFMKAGVFQEIWVED